MPTKAELEAELALLRQKAAERDAAPPADTPPQGEAAPPEGDAPDMADLAGWLERHGIKGGEAARLIENLGHELEDLARDKPLLTVGAAFALGFALGRMSK